MRRTLMTSATVAFCIGLLSSDEAVGAAVDCLWGCHDIPLTDSWSVGGGSADPIYTYSDPQAYTMWAPTVTQNIRALDETVDRWDCDANQICSSEPPLVRKLGYSDLRNKVVGLVKNECVPDGESE
jgi:hypothetical protein